MSETDKTTDSLYQIATFVLILGALVGSIVIPFAGVIIISVPIMLSLIIKAFIGLITEKSSAFANQNKRAGQTEPSPQKAVTKSAGSIATKTNIYALAVDYLSTPMSNAELLGLMLGIILLPAAACLPVAIVIGGIKYAFCENRVTETICQILAKF